MNRRQVLSGVGFLAVAATTVEKGRSQSSAGVANKALVATASDCVSKGEICLSHCLELLGTGDKSMAACSKSVNEMLAVCRAVVALAALAAYAGPANVWGVVGIGLSLLLLTRAAAQAWHWQGPAWARTDGH